MNKVIEQLVQIGKPYGVKRINFGGCYEGQVKGFKGAMRRKAHAHCHVSDDYRGCICVLSHEPHRRIVGRDGYPTRLFWHEVGHIYRRSWSEKQCDKFGVKMQREYKANNKPVT
jgi:hypothetical protein